jgi:hypothetical protein
MWLAELAVYLRRMARKSEPPSDLEITVETRLKRMIVYMRAAPRLCHRGSDFRSLKVGAHAIRRIDGASSQQSPSRESAQDPVEYALEKCSQKSPA